MRTEPFIKLSPALKDYLWGGEKLKQLYGASFSPVAEAWLLSAHPDGESVAAGGVCNGKPLRACLREALGQDGEHFPILVKLIDAQKSLSVQVHPDDEYARVHEHDNGKSEMWYVLESNPGAFLYVGFNREVTREEVKRRVEDGTIEEVLQKVPTHPGDAVFIPAGTVHAIGAGNLILEIQQSSNATYRLYDFKRRDAQGNLRPLHLDKALDVLNYHACGASGGQAAAKEAGELARCKYFSVYAYKVQTRLALPVPGGQFASVVCVSGEGTLARDGSAAPMKRGDSFYLPAGGGDMEITGDVNVVISYAKP